MDDEQQYFADILLAIKQVMSAHLQEIQEKFQQRFEKLEQDCRVKDEIIDQLRAHITELEKNNDDSLTAKHHPSFPPPTGLILVISGLV